MKNNNFRNLCNNYSVCKNAKYIQIRAAIMKATPKTFRNDSFNSFPPLFEIIFKFFEISHIFWGL